MQIKDTKRFLVGWGKAKGRIVFFVSHKYLPKTLTDPIVANPIDIARVLVNCVSEINKGRKK